MSPHKWKNKLCKFESKDSSFKTDSFNEIISSSFLNYLGSLLGQRWMTKNYRIFDICS